MCGVARDLSESRHGGSSVGLEPDTIIQAIKVVRGERSSLGQQPIPEAYEVENVSQRVVKLIIGTAKMSNQWDGINRDRP